MIGVLRSLKLDARDHGKVSRDGCKICMLPRCVDKAKGVNCQLSVYCPIDSVGWCSTILSCLVLSCWSTSVPTVTADPVPAPTDLEQGTCHASRTAARQH